MRVEAELTIEPFVPGERGPHVTAATQAATEAGTTVEIGPFGDRIVGEQAEVLHALSAALKAALDKGASRITIQLTNQLAHQAVTDS